jgi:hypothetical protein
MGAALSSIVRRRHHSLIQNPKSKIQNPFGLHRMRFSRMQLVGAVAVLLLIWAVVFYRLAFPAS